MSNANVPMYQEMCCNCHMVFWVPTSFHTQCVEQKSKKSFYCPAGHGQSYSGEADVDRERRLLQRAEQENARLAEEAASAERQRIKADRELKRHKKRAAAGVCPCCNRTVAQMAKHMKTKHPDYNVVPLKAVKA